MTRKHIDVLTTAVDKANRQTLKRWKEQVANIAKAEADLARAEEAQLDISERIEAVLDGWRRNEESVSNAGYVDLTTESVRRRCAVEGARQRLSGLRVASKTMPTTALADKVAEELRKVIPDAVPILTCTQRAPEVPEGARPVVVVESTNVKWDTRTALASGTVRVTLHRDPVHIDLESVRTNLVAQYQGNQRQNAERQWGNVSGPEHAQTLTVRLSDLETRAPVLAAGPDKEQVGYYLGSLLERLLAIYSGEKDSGEVIYASNGPGLRVSHDRGQAFVSTVKSVTIDDEAGLIVATGEVGSALQTAEGYNVKSLKLSERRAASLAEGLPGRVLPGIGGVTEFTTDADSATWRAVIRYAVNPALATDQEAEARRLERMADGAARMHQRRDEEHPPEGPQASGNDRVHGRARV